MDVEVVEVVPGEYDVAPAEGGDAVRVLVPAGVGEPGVPEDELAGAVVAELLSRGERLGATLDLAQLLRDDPPLVRAALARVDGEAG